MYSIERPNGLNNTSSDSADSLMPNSPAHDCMSSIASSADRGIRHRKAYEERQVQALSCSTQDVLLTEAAIKLPSSHLSSQVPVNPSSHTSSTSFAQGLQHENAERGQGNDKGLLLSKHWARSGDTNEGKYNILSTAAMQENYNAAREDNLKRNFSHGSSPATTPVSPTFALHGSTAFPSNWKIEHSNKGAIRALEVSPLPALFTSKIQTSIIPKQQMVRTSSSSGLSADTDQKARPFHGANPNRLPQSTRQIIHVPVFRVKKRILMKRQRQGCCGVLNLFQCCDSSSGMCSFLNFCGCLDREITTKYYPDRTTKIKVHPVYCPCC